MSGSISRLGEIMGDPGRPPLDVPWSGAVERFGVGLPSDYRELVDRYGPVRFFGDLVVVTPSFDPGEPSGQRFDDMHSFNQDLGEMLEQWYTWYPEVGRPYEPFPTPGGLLGWGNNTSADYFCWHMAGPDPDRWPVVVWHYGGDEMSRFDGGMAEFLAAVLDGDFPDAEELIDQTLNPELWQSTLD
ncbi:SMI1/KNR4 family protein [Kitasatospora sp. NPDC056446]|uniref:SMI1/KNR4 family protein n=1 Tax=Kitasatospora sp. NPDC056446 TaxID=3345819 RepID=UPI00367553E2